MLIFGKRFSIGDRVEIDVGSSGMVTETATIVRFYKHLVLYQKDNGIKFTLTLQEASKARVVCPSGFTPHDETMDRDAFLRAMDTAHKKI